jgi:hypothetical protein
LGGSRKIGSEENTMMDGPTTDAVEKKLLPSRLTVTLGEREKREGTTRGGRRRRRNRDFPWPRLSSGAFYNLCVAFLSC